MCTHTYTETVHYIYVCTHTHSTVTSTMCLGHVMKVLSQSNAADGSLMKTKPPVTLLVW